MKSTIKPLLIFLSLGVTKQSLAEFDPSRLTRAQQELDKNLRQESRLNRADVYSKVEAFKINDIEFEAEDDCFVLETLIIENDFLNDRNIKKIKSDSIGRCLGSKSILKLATALQDYFINSGYVTTRIDIPDQDLNSKALILNVIPGRIEKIVIESPDIRGWNLPFKAGQILNVRDLEQGLEALQKVPGLDVKINIAPGLEAGYSQVVIHANPAKNWNVRTWANNWGDEGTGENLIGGAGYLYNLTKMSDVFYVSGTTNAEHKTGRYDSISAYYSIPVGYWDYEFFYSQSKSRQNISVGPYDFNYFGDSEYVSAKAYRTVYRDTTKKITLSGEIFRRKVSNHLEDIELALQKRNMTNIRIGANLKKKIPGAILDTTISYQRFVPWLDAEETPDMKTGDVSKKSHVFNLDVDYSKLMKLAKRDGYYNLRLGAQYAPKPLTLQDRITVGDRWNVRGFEKSAGLDGNSGFYVQNTINVITGFKNIEWFFGADYGVIFKDNEVHKRDKHLLGATTGFRGSYKSFGYGMSVSKPLNYPNTLQTDELTLNFNLYYQL